VLRVGLIMIVFLAVLDRHALAQIVPGMIGPFPPMQDDLARHHRGPTGSACLAIRGYAKPETINKDIYQHLIKATNGCGQAIKFQVCYYKTEHCIDMNVPAWEQKESVLGIFPALKGFRFEVKEQF
jgi:hypothetical protein